MYTYWDEELGSYLLTEEGKKLTERDMINIMGNMEHSDHEAIKRTCENCKHGDRSWDLHPCNRCTHKTDNWLDFWEEKEDD